MERNKQPFYHRIEGLLFTSTSALGEATFIKALKKMAKDNPKLGILPDSIEIEMDMCGEPEPGDPADLL